MHSDPGEGTPPANEQRPRRNPQAAVEEHNSDPGSSINSRSWSRTRLTRAEVGGRESVLENRAPSVTEPYPQPAQDRDEGDDREPPVPPTNDDRTQSPHFFHIEYHFSEASNASSDEPQRGHLQAYVEEDQSPEPVGSQQDRSFESSTDEDGQGIGQQLVKYQYEDVGTRQSRREGDARRRALRNRHRSLSSDSDSASSAVSKRRYVKVPSARARSPRPHTPTRSQLLLKRPRETIDRRRPRIPSESPSYYDDVDKFQPNRSAPPTRRPVISSKTYSVLESAGLSKRIPVRYIQEANPPFNDASEAWGKQKTYLDANAITAELCVIRNAEFSSYVGSGDKVILTCASGPEPESPKRSDTMRWMHIQRDCPSLDVLLKFVVSCPFISAELRVVTLSALFETSQQAVSHGGEEKWIELGTATRYMGYDSEAGPTRDTEPVTFFSAPYLDLRVLDPQDAGGYHENKPLLHNFHGYRVNTSREQKQVVQKLPAVSGGEALHVSQMWCLVIGSDVLITCGGMAADKLRGKLVTIAEDKQRVVTIIGLDHCTHKTAIRDNYSLAEMLGHAVKVSNVPQDDPDGYKLAEPNGRILTPERWLFLMSTETELPMELCLRSKRGRKYLPDTDPPTPKRGRPYLITGPPAPGLSRSPDEPMTRALGSRRSHSPKYIEARGPSPEGAPDDKRQPSPKSRDGALVPRGAPRSEHYLSPFNARFDPVGRESGLLRQAMQVGYDSSDSEDLIGENRSLSPSRLLRRENKARDDSEDGIVLDPKYRRRMPDVLLANAATRSRGDEEPQPTNGLHHSRKRPSWKTPARSVLGQTKSTADSKTNEFNNDAPSRRSENRVRFTNGARATGGEKEGKSGAAPARQEIGTKPIPFLKWGVRGEQSSRADDEVNADFLTVLDHIKLEMGHGMYRTAYLSTFRCTKNELLSRHGVERPWCRDLAETTPDRDRGRHIKSEDPHFSRQETRRTSPMRANPFQTQPLAAGFKQNEIPANISAGDTSLETAQVSEQSQGKKAENPTSSTGQGDTNPQPRGISPTSQEGNRNPLCTCTQLMKQLFQTAENLMNAFVGDSGDSSASGQSHDISRCLWGSVDVIWRQMIRSGTRMKKDNGGLEAYTIRSFDDIYSKLGDDSRSAYRELSWGDCPECSSGKEYLGAADALNHMGAKHVKLAREPHHLQARPAENPNYCWITSPLDTGDDGGADDWPGYMEIRFFISDLVRISKLYDKLLRYVVRPHNPSSGSGSEPPFLPSTLTSAFCRILASYLFVARLVTLLNRDECYLDPGKAYYAIKVRHLRTSIYHCFHQATELLSKARLDVIILCSTRREMDCVRVQAVGTHFLAMAFLQNLQAFVLPGSGGQDAVQVYRRYLSVLRHRASRRPQRRLFLDIQGFQEELEALKSLTDSQIAVSETYARLLYPGSFRVTSTERVDKYEAEYELWRKLDKTLEHRWRDLNKLTEQSRLMKDDVKQAIEILEEDHGKAIRVFTVVTLFFLPLSFVSSFMGMNTTDIRDTQHGQGLFWAVAVPVTASIVTLAFTYGYKGDEIFDWVRDWVWQWKEPQREPRRGHSDRTLISKLDRGLTETWQTQASGAARTKTW